MAQRKKRKDPDIVPDSSVDADIDTPLSVVQVKLSPSALLIKRLMSSIPLNDYSLPLCIYRTDLLPEADSEGRVIPQTAPNDAPDGSTNGSLDGALNGAPDAVYRDDEMTLVDSGDGTLTLEYAIPTISMGLPTASELAAATIDVEYDEAYPTLSDGRPIWMQFDFETPPAYAAFEVFLLMGDIDGEGGIRRLIDVPESLRLKGLDVTTWQVKDWYYIYFWAWRVKAYDIFRSVQKVKTQRTRAAKVVDTHYDKSVGLMSKLMRFMEDDESFWELMTPIAAINMYRELIKVQRLSAGLPAAAPADLGGSSNAKGDGGLQLNGLETMQELFRKFASRESITQNASEEEELAAIASVLDDGDSLQATQELVFKLLERPHHKERQAAVLRAPQVINDDPNQASES